MEYLVVQDKGGLITLKDLADHRTEKVEPISYTYRSKTAPDGQPITLHEIPPNGQGITALIALGILDELEQSGKIKLDKEMQNSAEALHAMMLVVVFSTRLLTDLFDLYFIQRSSTSGIC